MISYLGDKFAYAADRRLEIAHTGRVRAAHIVAAARPERLARHDGDVLGG